MVQTPNGTSDGMEMVIDFLDRAHLVFADIPPLPFGSGVAVGWGENHFVVIAIGADATHQCSITSGILRDVDRNEVPVLRLCNRHNQDLSAHPVHLHDASSGWDILQKNVVPLVMLREHPEFVLGWHLDNVTAIAEDLREKAAEVGLGGEPYQWGQTDRARLLIRSLT